MRKQVYIHYGHDQFNKEEFNEVINESLFMTKPFGGLWASPINSHYGWKDWCIQEDFRTDRLNNWFKFVFVDESKILHIKSIDDLVKLPMVSQTPSGRMCKLDFEKIKKDYDAIQVHISDEEISIDTSFTDSLYCRLYGWDCDSILVMNKDAINIISCGFIDENIDLKGDKVWEILSQFVDQ